MHGPFCCVPNHVNKLLVPTCIHVQIVHGPSSLHLTNHTNADYQPKKTLVKSCLQVFRPAGPPPPPRVDCLVPEGNKMLSPNIQPHIATSEIEP